MRRVIVSIGSAILCGLVCLWLVQRHAEPGSVAARAPNPADAKDHASKVLPTKSALTPSMRAEDSVSSPAEPVAAFAHWLARFQAADAVEKAKLLPTGEKLARARRHAFYDLIAKDPAAALAAAVGEPSRRMLPDEITSLLERTVSGKGDLSVFEDDGPANRPGRRDIYRKAWIDGRSYDAYVYGRRADMLTKYGTSLLGVAVEDRLAVLEEPVRLMSKSDLPPGAVLEKPLAPPNPSRRPVATTDSLVLQVGGQYFPVMSAEHAHEVAARWSAIENRPGPVVQALGESLPGLEAAPLASSLAASHLLGAQSVLVILADFTDAQGAPVDSTVAQPYPTINNTLVQQRIATEVADFYTQASYGKATIGTVTVTGVLRMPSTLASYATANNDTGMKNDALTKAKAAGFNPANYDRQMVVFANTHGITSNKFGWSGLADIGGSFIWMNGNLRLGVAAHEMGHTFGLYHANLWQIPGGSSDPLDPAGSSNEYGDPFDIMGGAIGDSTVQPDPPNPWYLNRLGWLPDGAVQTITSDSSPSYRVYRFDHKNASLSHPLALRVNRNEGTDYWISYRRKYAGYQGYADMGQGAYVFWAKSGFQTSQLIDIDTPGNDATDASLNVGSTLTDSAAGITLKVVQAGGTVPDEYLDVQVNFQSRVAFEHKVNNVDERGGSVTLKVNRLNSGAGIVTAHYTTVPGTAVQGINYTTTANTLTWGNGDLSTKTIQIPILVDPTGTSTTFTVKFDSSSGCVFPSGNEATVNIEKAGATDTQFVHPDFSREITALAIQPDGQIVVGGNFDNTSGSITSSGLIRLQKNGALDTSFDQGSGVGPIPDAIGTMALQPDGKILVGGDLNTIRGVSRNKLARLLPNGSLDTTFDSGTGPNGTVNAIAVQPDGKILVGGKFTTWNGVTHKALVRLTDTGSLDATFSNFESQVTFFTGFEEVFAVTLQPIAVSPYFTIVVGGSFYRSGTNAQAGIVRLLSTGVRDAVFSPTQGAFIDTSLGQVQAIAVQPDGKIVVGGFFNKFNNVNAGRIARLTSTGANDATFVTNTGTGLTSTKTNCTVTLLKIQPDGGIVAGGFFEKAVDVPLGIARFTSSGSRDTGFNPDIEIWSGNGVLAMDMAPDNSVIIGLNNAGGNPLVAKRIFTGAGASAGVVEFSSVATSAVEGTPATLKVSRVGGSAGNVSVNYQTVDGSAVAGTHFTNTAGTLTWADGDTSDKSIVVPTTLRSAIDPDLVLSVNLGIPIGGASLGQRAVASITVQDAVGPNVPKVSFASASTSVTESAASLTVTVNLDMAHTDTITVPVAVTGTATVGKDYTLAASSVTFGSGSTTQDITINLLDDNIAEPNETLILTLKAPTVGTAMLGTAVQHTITITDNESVPTFSSSPVNATVAVGGNAMFQSVAGGVPAPGYQWFKDKVKMTSSGTGQDLSLTNIQLTQAGQYSVTATNPFGNASRAAELGVVNTTPLTVNAVSGGTATLTVVSAGNLLSYSWTKGGIGAPNPPRITASAKSLVILKASAADAGTYVCNVANPGSAPVPVSIKLNVLDNPPIVTNTSKLDDAIVSGSYYYPITVDSSPNRTPTSYSATGLPAGLVCNPVTGVISGKPTVKGPFSVTLKATNGRGTGSVTLPLAVADMTTNTVGAYTGVIERNVAINLNLGGKINLNVTAAGTYTGSLTLGATGYPFSGALNTATNKTTADGDTTLTIAAKASAHLTFTLDPSNNSLINGVLTANSSTLAFTGWRGVVPSSKSTGYQTFSLKIDNSVAGNDSYPQGLGYGSFTIPATSATFPVAGVLADGTAFTSTTSLGPQGELLVYQCLYTGARGSLVGKLTVTQGAMPAPLNKDSTTTGTVSWCRPAIAGRTYAVGFLPVNVKADGGRIDVTTATVMPSGFTEKTNNAVLGFTLAHVTEGSPVPASPDLQFTLKKGGVASVPGLPNRTTFAFVAATGAFSGSFVQTTPSRTGTYKGMLVNHGGTIQGDGWFTLPQALPTPTTSVILSGAVELVNQP